jgi:hypothetical protein
MNDDPYAARRHLTFEQAEGVEPLPAQLKTKELSQELRALLWNTLYRSLKSSVSSPSWMAADVAGRPFITGKWKNILLSAWVERDHKMVDEFSADFQKNKIYVKNVMEGTYATVFGFIQFVLRHPDCPGHLATLIGDALHNGRAPYRVLDNTTLVPIGSDHEAATIQRAFSDLEKEELHGARSHLKSAGSHLTGRDYAASIRDSIHAVESAVCAITGSKDFTKALNLLKEDAPIHGALKSAILSIYGYTSDERGIRHSLLDQEEALVDEADALFMLGACASFVSYLINKARSAGFLDRKILDGAGRT